MLMASGLDRGRNHVTQPRLQTPPPRPTPRDGSVLICFYYPGASLNIALDHAPSQEFMLQELRSMRDTLTRLEQRTGAAAAVHLRNADTLHYVLPTPLIVGGGASTLTYRPRQLDRK